MHLKHPTRFYRPVKNFQRCTWELFKCFALRFLFTLRRVQAWYWTFEKNMKLFNSPKESRKSLHTHDRGHRSPRTVANESIRDGLTYSATPDPTLLSQRFWDQMKRHACYDIFVFQRPGNFFQQLVQLVHCIYMCICLLPGASTCGD